MAGPSNTERRRSTVEVRARSRYGRALVRKPVRRSLILGVVALLVFPTWQERWIGINEWNHQFVILPDWGLAGVLVGLMVVLTAAVKANVLGRKA